VRWYHLQSLVLPLAATVIWKPANEGTAMNTPVLETSLEDLPVRRGKVRDIYELKDQLLMVSTDRISAYDWVIPTGIPDKGRVLTQISAFWFDLLDTPNHLLSLELDGADLPASTDLEPLVGRSMLVRKCDVVPIECVVRGYLDGSGWKEYQETGEVCGIKLPGGLLQGDKLESPIFTPATKAETGHDFSGHACSREGHICSGRSAHPIVVATFNAPDIRTRTSEPRSPYAASIHGSGHARG